MRKIKLHFPLITHLTTLVHNKGFMAEIEYLKPFRIDSNTILLVDPIELHNELETELVILSKFAFGIKSVLFADTNHDIIFINPFLGQRKYGLVHNNVRIIDRTEFEY